MTEIDPDTIDYLALEDDALLAQCSSTFQRASGPGGQHRNKVSTAVVLRHGPTGIKASAADSRSQAQNRANAMKRLRMNIACQRRRPIDPHSPALPEAVRECIFTPTKGPPDLRRPRLTVGPRDHRYWQVVSVLLDLVDACGGRLSMAAKALGITTSNLVTVLKEDRHANAAAGAILKRHGKGSMK